MLAISYISDDAERDILARLYRDYHNAMLLNVLKIVHDRSAAEDVVADAVLSLMDKAYKLDGMSRNACVAYMVKTAQRQAYKYNKGAWRQKVTLMLDDPDPPQLPDVTDIGPEDILLLHEHRAKIAAALRQLSERDQMLLECRYFRGMPNKEIAKLMHLSEDKVKKYMYMARRRALPRLKRVIENGEGR